MQGTGFRQNALALLQNVSNVFTTEGLELGGIFDGSGGQCDAVDFAHGHDLAGMLNDVQPALLQFPIERLCLGRECQQAHDYFLVLSLAPVLQQFSGMIWIFKVLIAAVAAYVTSDEFVMMIDTQVIGIDFHCQQGGSKLGRYRVCIGIMGSTNNPFNAAFDDDGDGQENLTEFLAGTDPKDKESYLRIDSIQITAQGTAIAFTPRTNHGYTVQFREGINRGQWQVLSHHAVKQTLRTSCGLPRRVTAATRCSPRRQSNITPVVRATATGARWLVCANLHNDTRVIIIIIISGFKNVS